MLVLSFVVGIMGGYSAVGFRYLIDTIQTFSFGIKEGPEFIETVRSLPLYYRLFIPATGGLLVGPIIFLLAAETKGSGVPEVIESIVTKGGQLPSKVIPLKAIASSLTIGTGGSAGREGPIVQIVSSIGSACGQFLNLNKKKIKTLVGCGASAGIAGTFNAPVGGIMFSLEILLENFQIAQFSPIVISSVISTVISQAYFGQSPAFISPEYSAVSNYELIFYLLLGVISGIIAVKLHGFLELP